jgi:hypothetical protein
MYRLGLSVAALALLIACSSSDSLPVSPPAQPAVDTLVVSDPTQSPTPGTIHFNLTRNVTSNVPAAADSALVKIYNSASGFSETFGASIPTPGSATTVTARVPADTGYVVAILAFHGSTLDSYGSTSDNDTTITVWPEGNPTYTNTPVHVEMSGGNATPGYSIDDGSHVVQGEHISWQAYINTPRDIWTDVESSWGCSFNQNQCAVYSYQGTIGVPLGPWLLETTFIANWKDHTFRSNTASITVIVDQGTGGIDVTFNRHHKAQH